MHRVPGVAGPQAGERLAHRTEDCLHLFRLDRFAAEGESFVPAALCKDAEEGDRVHAVSQEGINFVFQAESCPSVPTLILFFCLPGTDAIADGFLCKAEISFEVHAELSGQRVHKFVCGKTSSK